jgi:hypothetical protein
MKTEIAEGDNIIDSRDVIQRIEDLENERENTDDKETWDNEEDGVELRSLKALAEQTSGYADDWTHGKVLISDDYFETYAQELAEDIGAMPDTSAWPARCIDWKQAADELKQDYTAVEYGATTYWIR